MLDLQSYGVHKYHIFFKILNFSLMTHKHIFFSPSKLLSMQKAINEIIDLEKILRRTLLTL